MSLTASEALAIAATPPSSLNSLMRNSFTQTSPLTTRPELLRIPIMMFSTFSSVGLPMTVMRFCGLPLASSYVTYGVVLLTPEVPCLLARLRASLALVSALKGKSK